MACCAVRIGVSWVNLPASVCVHLKIGSMSPQRAAGTALSKALLYNVIINVLPLEEKLLLILENKMHVPVVFTV